MWLPHDDKTYKALDELKTASDRSLAILAGSILESQVTEFLHQAFRRDGSDYNRKIRAQLFGADGALGSFGPKISLLYLWGIITEWAHADLTNLKNIRNLFAHYSEHNSFDSQKIRDLCANFKLLDVKVCDPFEIRRGGDKPVAVKVGGFLTDSDGAFFMAVPNKQEALSRPRGRFTATAQLFCACLGEAIRQEKDEMEGKPGKSPKLRFPIL